MIAGAVSPRGDIVALAEENGDLWICILEADRGRLRAAECVSQGLETALCDRPKVVSMRFIPSLTSSNRLSLLAVDNNGRVIRIELDTTMTIGERGESVNDLQLCSTQSTYQQNDVYELNGDPGPSVPGPSDPPNRDLTHRIDEHPGHLISENNARQDAEDLDRYSSQSVMQQSNGVGHSTRSERSRSSLLGFWRSKSGTPRR